MGRYALVYSLFTVFFSFFLSQMGKMKLVSGLLGQLLKLPFLQVTRSVDTEFGQLSTQEQMTVDAIVQAR
jgi:hypothetical protein